MGKYYNNNYLKMSDSLKQSQQSNDINNNTGSPENLS